jgi:outer membrane biosynthesis protein TonB
MSPWSGGPRTVLCTVALCVMVRLTADVQLSLLVGADGALKNVRVITGHPLLTAGAIEMVKSWRFTPGSINGVPVEMETRATLAMAIGGASLPDAALLPAYPGQAREGAVSGVVDMRAVVAPDGAVVSVDIVDGPEILRQASADAVRRWRYESSAVTGPTAIPVEIAFQCSRPSMCPAAVAVGALVPPAGPLSRPKPGVVPPRLR